MTNLLLSSGLATELVFLYSRFPLDGIPLDYMRLHGRLFPEQRKIIRAHNALDVNSTAPSISRTSAHLSERK